MGTRGTAESDKETRAKLKQMIKDELRAGKELRSILEAWNREAEDFDAMPRSVAPACYIKIYHYENALHFHYIKRQCPNSPNGWGLEVVDEPWLPSEAEVGQAQYDTLHDNSNALSNAEILALHAKMSKIHESTVGIDEFKLAHNEAFRCMQALAQLWLIRKGEHI